MRENFAICLNIVIYCINPMKSSCSKHESTFAVLEDVALSNGVDSSRKEFAPRVAK